MKWSQTFFLTGSIFLAASFFNQGAAGWGLLFIGAIHYVLGMLNGVFENQIDTLERRAELHKFKLCIEYLDAFIEILTPKKRKTTRRKRKK